MFSPGQHAPPPYPGQGQLGQPSHLQPTTPMFVAPPPKTQRVLHSEAYLKYIEGLNSESATVSKWDQTLKGGVSLGFILISCHHSPWCAGHNVVMVSVCRLTFL